MTYELTYRRASTVAPIFKSALDGNDCLTVLDLLTGSNMEVKVKEISPYRHTVLHDGREFHLLNVARLA